MKNLNSLRSFFPIEKQDEKNTAGVHWLDGSA